MQIFKTPVEFPIVFLLFEFPIVDPEHHFLHLKSEQDDEMITLSKQCHHHCHALHRNHTNVRHFIVANVSKKGYGIELT